MCDNNDNNKDDDESNDNSKIGSNTDYEVTYRVCIFLN